MLRIRAIPYYFLQACFVFFFFFFFFFFCRSGAETQLQEDDSLGPITLRRDLLSVLYDAKNWNLQCIEAGETNIKVTCSCA